MHVAPKSRFPHLRAKSQHSTLPLCSSLLAFVSLNECDSQLAGAEETGQSTSYTWTSATVHVVCGEDESCVVVKSRWETMIFCVDAVIHEAMTSKIRCCGPWLRPLRYIKGKCVRTVAWQDNPSLIPSCCCLFFPQALCATGLLTITPVGPMDSPTPLSVCHVHGICRGIIKVNLFRLYVSHVDA